MFHFHDWKYIGWQPSWHWLAGVSGGIQVESETRAKQCTKCGKIQAV